jgi:hypothetical protein
MRGLDAFIFLVPDRADGQIRFEFFECLPHFGELDIQLPESGR